MTSPSTASALTPAAAALPRFGVNLSTSAAPGADPVADARTAERLGFDFVSASDHPGSAHPSYETWTLLTWVAAATTRITVMPKVLGVPFRVPALAAKAAESLSRLSAGRLILGLGASSDDQEVASVGQPVRTPGGKLRGLAEAIEITRGLWREPAFSYPGEIYRTESAQLEPKPSWPIPIWLGTFGPRALDLTGRLADGWIPSLGYVPDDQMPVMRQRVLDAAAASGRDPASVTCALNLAVTVGPHHRGSGPFEGPATKIADGLHHYVELGFTAFNLSPAGDHPAAQTELLAAEVLPALRPS
jgi:alkanesulfonate monooxygenase SsuD/methylene tetrahydromethanopterin reductase-like flavin-dependent oxidoreductase (luciferase family)